MSDATTHLLLPYILAAQAQKHITHNEALRILDGLVQLSVLDRDLTAPPGSLAGSLCFGGSALPCIHTSTDNCIRKPCTAVSALTVVWIGFAIALSCRSVAAVVHPEYAVR